MRVPCDRQCWGRDSPLRPLTRACKEFGVANSLKVEPECLIKRQGKLIRRVVAFPIGLDVRSKVKLLNGSAELSP